MTAAEELRAAAVRLREWAAEPSADRWAPGAAEAFGPALADWLETTGIRLHHSTHPDWQANIEPHALALARLVLGDDCPKTRKEAR